MRILDALILATSGRWPESVARKGGPNSWPSFATGAPTRFARPSLAPASLARPGPTWAQWWRSSAASLTRPNGHATTGPRSRGGTLRIRESVPGPPDQPGAFARRTVSWDGANRRVSPGCSPGERSQTAPHAEPLFSRRQQTARVGKQRPPRSDPRGLRRFSPELRAFRALRVLRRCSRVCSQRAPSELDERRVGQLSRSLSCPVGREKPRGV